MVKQHRYRVIAACSVAFSIALTVAGAFHQNITYDEGNHLRWSERLLSERNSSRDDGQGFISATPVTLINVVGLSLMRPLARRFGELFISRLPTMLVFILLLWVVFHFVRNRFGETAACLACAGLSLDPNMIAAAGLVTVDLAYATASLLVLISLIHLAESRSWRSCFLAGAAIGLAFCTKVTACILTVCCLIALPSLFGLRMPSWKAIPVYLCMCACVLATATLVICAGYLFVDVGWRPSELVFQSSLFSLIFSHLPDCPVPLPKGLLLQIDGLVPESIFGTVGRKAAYRTVILGDLKQGGTWYYFAVVWLLKTPILLLVAIIGGMSVAAFKMRLLRRSTAYRFLAICCLLHLLYFSFLFHNQIGIRYVLMCIPLLFVLSAPGWNELLTRRRSGFVLTAVLLVTAAEHLVYFGQPIAFTNMAVQPKKNVYRLITDSNVDWNQNHENIETMLEADGIEKSNLNPIHVLAGHNTFQLNHLSGALRNYHQHRWVRENLVPYRHYGFTYMAYEVSEEAFARFLDEERIIGHNPNGRDLCAALSRSHASEGATAGVIDIEDFRGKREAACIQAEDTTDLVMRIRGKGEAGIGFADAAGDCAGRVSIHYLQPDSRREQEIWYRLRAGHHIGCIWTSGILHGEIGFEPHQNARILGRFSVAPGTLDGKP